MKNTKQEIENKYSFEVIDKNTPNYLKRIGKQELTMLVHMMEDLNHAATNFTKEVYGYPANGIGEWDETKLAQYKSGSLTKRMAGQEGYTFFLMRNIQGQLVGLASADAGNKALLYLRNIAISREHKHDGSVLEHLLKNISNFALDNGYKKIEIPLSKNSQAMGDVKTYQEVAEKIGLKLPLESQHERWLSKATFSNERVLLTFIPEWFVSLQENKGKTILNNQGEVIDVLDHILDLVAKEAHDYFSNSNINDPKDRLLGSYSEEAKKKIFDISTHTKVNTPERRALHREIILQMVGGKKAPADGKETIILFAGPPGAGKSALRARFEEGQPFEEQSLEEAHQIYKSAMAPGSYVSPDFDLFKRKLPEYNSANIAFKEKYGDMYAVIRSEASGLNQATLQFARELSLTRVLEQLMDVDGRGKEEFAQLAKGNLYVFGVTCDPELSRSRVAQRPKPMQDEEVSRAVRGFSGDGSFSYLSQIAQKSYLLDTNDKYKTVFVSEKGKEINKDEAEFTKFKEHVNFNPLPSLGQVKVR